MSLVCIDNHVLIWGIRKQASPTQQEMIERAAQFLESLDEKRVQVIVPMPVVAEFLVGADEKDHATILQTFHERFILAPYDALAALATARVRKKNLQSQREAAVRQELAEMPRPQIAVDHMIIGIALANRAECIYTHDKPLKRFAEGHIAVREIPLALERQLPLHE